MFDYQKDMSLSFRRILIDIRCVSLSCLFYIFSWNLLSLSDRLRCIYMWISKFVRWRESNLKFKRLSATLYLFLQAVVVSMSVAVAFPDFSGFLAFRAPNIGFPKSGSNGSISRADIPRTDIDRRNMSSRTESPQYYVEVRSSWLDLTLSLIQIHELVLNFSSVPDSDFFNVDRIWICLLYLSIKWLSIELTQILYIHSEFYIYER